MLARLNEDHSLADCSKILVSFFLINISAKAVQ